ncbi:hypothetical protein BJ878DRAFT_169918 [Calycina marina]|uniref:Methyltransferase type 11 domain-containing protein n=1 Tax=Calycina marina TaxID=1763456 RepID=A0A9P7YZ35_9HELO|nr:hypothetical protein BJ878DRAFT_169918 [Calycina marina]
MFDVSWDDPSRETRRQHKTRKDAQGSGLSRGSSVRSSESGNSKNSRSSETGQGASRPALFGSFGIFGGKKNDTAKVDSRPNPPQLKTEEKAAKRLSNYLPPQEAPAYTKSTPATTVRRESTDTEEPSDVSVFSGRTGRSAHTHSNTDSTWSNVTDPSQTNQTSPPLCQGSFVTQSTEVRISKRNSINATDQLASSVHISADGTMPLEVRDSSLSQTSETFDFPVARSQLKEKITKQILREDIQLSPKGFPVTVRTRNGDSWQPPDAWECPVSPVEAGTASKVNSRAMRPRTKERKAANSSDLAHLRRSIRKMEAASTKILLERLKEEWTEIVDAAVYRELELEKQLWLLCALRCLNKKKGPGQPTSLPLNTAAEPVKILSLYENPATASFLAATTVGAEVHHLSSQPLSPRAYPNVHPLSIPSPTSTLPYASSVFKAIHAFSIPIQLPANSLPALLKECHRSLIPGGTLHLTIIDPSPLPPTLGPLLRTWLDKNLFISLERQFRCMNPSRLFPVWLSDAGLRAAGSTITTTNFYACPTNCASADSSQSSIDGFVISNGGSEVEEKVKSLAKSDGRRELKSQVGRMLWRETWGAFVEGHKWWWDDEDILEECERMGTVWEFAVIDAVNE